jgi:hypothetical protein
MIVFLSLYPGGGTGVRVMRGYVEVVEKCPRTCAYAWRFTQLETVQSVSN